MKTIFPKQFWEFEKYKGSPLIDTQVCDLFTAIWEYRKTASVFHLAE